MWWCDLDKRKKKRSDCSERKQESEQVQFQLGRRPFPNGGGVLIIDFPTEERVTKKNEGWKKRNIWKIHIKFYFFLL